MYTDPTAEPMKLGNYFSAKSAVCPACSAEVKSGINFCTECGAPLEPDSPPEPVCSTCGGEGATLAAERVFCRECRWLRPLGREYKLPVDAFLWKFDADAMKALRSMGPLTTAAHSISKRVGRPWLEASIGGVRLSERQLPWIFEQAVRAARIVGLPVMPEIYVSGDQGWEADTLGSDSSSFVVLGSMLTRFRKPELSFILGREMGHCRAGHTLWRTIAQLASGHLQKRQPLFSQGLLQFLHPSRLVETAIDAPLMAWSRQATITADRAGLLVSGQMDVARRVFLTSSLRLFPLYEQIDMGAWLEQEREAADMTSQLSEWTSASAPYLNRRIQLASQFTASDEFRAWRKEIEKVLPPETELAPTPARSNLPRPQTPSVPEPNPDAVRFLCQSCSKPIRIARAALAARSTANIRCPFCKTVCQFAVPQPS